MTSEQENNQIIIYQSNDGQMSFNVNVFEETVWLTQKQMAELFDRDRKTITRHISNIFKEGELQEELVCSYFEHTTQHGAIKGKEQIVSVKYYNLDVIISVGYRVKSQRGTQFRIWATSILKQYLTNGFAINEIRVRAILDEYVGKLRSEFKDDIQKVYQKISEIKPVNIYNQVSLTSTKLEEKAIELIDEVINQLKDNKLKTELQELKKAVQALPKDQKSKSKILDFFKRLGDSNSRLHKTIKGAGIAKKVMTELIKLGEKLKDLIL